MEEIKDLTKNLIKSDKNVLLDFSDKLTKTIQNNKVKKKVEVKEKNINKNLENNKITIPKSKSDVYTLTKLSTYIEKLISSRQTYPIKKPEELLLRIELLTDEVIGLDSAKNKIALDILNIIQKLKKGKNIDGCQNILITGEPGTCKTTIAIHLAGMYDSIGVINEYTYDYSNIITYFNDEENYQKIIIIISVIATILGGLSFAFSIISSTFKNVNLNLSKGPAQLFLIGLFVLFSVVSIAGFLIYYMYNNNNISNNNIGNNDYVSLYEQNINLENDIVNNIGNVAEKKNDCEKCSDKKCSTCLSKKRKLIKERKKQILANNMNNIVLPNRSDLIGKYIGTSDKKTDDFIKRNKGKTIIFDEFPSLCYGPNDMYGKEAMKMINIRMTENPKDQVIIAMGYEDDILKGPFTAERGLPSRFKTHIKCEGASGEELYDIFKLKLNKSGFVTRDNENHLIKNLIVKNAESFKSYGRDIKKLLEYSEQRNTERLSIEEDELMNINYGNGNSTIEEMFFCDIEKGFSDFLDNSSMDKKREMYRTDKLQDIFMENY